MLRRNVAVRKASAQNFEGIDELIRRVLMISLMVRRERSALPFWGEVYGQEKRRRMPCWRKKID